MRRTQQLGAILLFCFATGCASGKRTYQEYAAWDSNSDKKIGRSQFVKAYMAQGYFDKWGEDGRSIRYEDLFNEAFESLDSDEDQKLSLVEFNSQIKLFYFGLFNETFDRWDDDSNASISRNEFLKHIASTNLANMWDTDDNNRITEREMAGGMFYIADADSNGSVDENELNLWKRNRKIDDVISSN